MTTDTTVVPTDETKAAAEESAAAEAAFGQTRGADPQSAPAVPAVVDAPVKTEAEIEADNKAAEETRLKAEEDAWLNSAPEPWRNRLQKIDKIEATANQIGATQRRLKSVEDRIGAITESATKAAQAAKDAGESAPTAAQITAAIADPKRFEKLREDFPDFAAPIEAEFAELRGALAKRGSADVDVDGISIKVVERFAPNLREVENRARQMARIDSKHEDWEDTIKTPEFAAWIQAQPDDIKALADSYKAKDAIKLLDTYAEAAKPKDQPADTPAKPDPKSRLEAAVAPTSGKTAGAGRETITEAQAADAAFKRIRGG